MVLSWDHDLARQKKKSQQTQNLKEPAQIHDSFLMESEAVVIGGKNLTYISKLAASQKKKKQPQYKYNCSTVC